MTYSTHIAAAKRMARGSARRSGASYQTTLEDIARASGRSDWADFLARPTAPIEPQRSERAEVGSTTPVPVETPAPAPEPEPVPIMDPVAAALTTASKPMLMTMVGLAVTGLVCFAPLREESLWAMVVGSQIAITLLVTAVIATVSYGAMTMRGLRSAGRARLVRATTLLAAIAGIQTGASAMSAWVMMRSPGWRLSIPADEAMLVEEDRLNSEHIRFVGWDRDTPIASVSRDGRGLTMTIVPIDDRMRPARRDAPLHIGDRMGGRTMQAAMVEHPVFRIRGRMECASSTFVPQAFELADRYRSATVVSHPYDGSTSGRAFAMRRDDAARICASSRSAPHQDSVESRRPPHVKTTSVGVRA